MKKLLIFPVVAVLVASCFKAEPTDPQADALVIVEQYMTTKSYQVPVRGDGTISQVVYFNAEGDSVILATTDMPLTIQIPASVDADGIANVSARTRAGEQPAEYIAVRNYAAGTKNFEANSYIKDGNSVLMFEDSRVGDFDYNDLVLYVRHSIRGNNTTTPATITMYIKPVALGSANTIAFGWEDGNGEHMLSNDVRRDYFNNGKGIINAYSHMPFIEPVPVVDDGSGNQRGSNYEIFRDRSLMERARSEDPKLDQIVGGYFKYDPVPTTCSSSSNDTKMIKWFIKTSGYKYYVSSIDKGAPQGTFPYGIAIPNGYHSFEGQFIGKAYPGFESWIATGSPVNWHTTKVSDKLYTKHVNYERW